MKRGVAFAAVVLWCVLAPCAIGYWLAPDDWEPIPVTCAAIGLIYVAGSFIPHRQPDLVDPARRVHPTGGLTNNEAMRIVQEARDEDEVGDLQEAVRGLHDFIVDQLDPEPEPVESYLTDKGAQAAARRAMELRPIRHFGLVQPDTEGGK